MDHDIEEGLPASQASSHFPLLEPISGATLYKLESARRETLRRRGRVRTGCAEVDDAVLLGGLERGSVVGVSAEDVEFGLLVGLQIVAHTMVFEGANKQRAAIVTTLTPAAILPVLRDVIRAQVQVALGPTANQKQDVVNAEVRRCLERISISRVFDIEGLWEVLSELETPASFGRDAAAPEGKEEEVPSTTTTTEDKEHSAHAELLGLFPPGMSKEEDKDETVEDIPPSPPPKTKRMEVADSEDEEELSLSPPSLPEQQPSASPPPSSLPKASPSPAPPPAIPPAQTTTPSPASTGNHEKPPHIPDLILITHFSALLANLFTRSADNKAGAHTTLQLLSSHLRYLARSSAGPLVMLLNSTTAATTTAASISTPVGGPSTSAGTSHVPQNPASAAATAKDRPLEPTLRSVFLPAGGRRQSKPAFGATFAQFLDLHLLCTRVPRARADAEALAAGTSGLGRWCWVVEVLLDELGVEGSRGGGEGDNKALDGGGGNGRTWKSREQRWGAVDVRGKVRLVDAILGG
ncbi:hypothetical protein F4813DRAFT_44199 [Daldinia decipiens]|uniref:uncharacterized protein n=1 Tax=Daldinia decipiens TaxID=326647 RepID=UPI0020C3C39E|nr:uncharacterized protein F4813DRAFT_44199 [Daldinia decipiens]KAI1658779.1 hypothetical protein F4813DRAFT_44199 [Daldinia decipiens]